IFGVDGQIFEVQIRTHNMDEIAENGVAAPIVKRLKFDEGKLRDVVAGRSSTTSSTPRSPTTRARCTTCPST
ncbi:MAG: hypothetical protein II084_01410, partial [Clostridia bacterium]|nr:hypothetical protein [Clostridia bacterium]